MQLKQNIYKNIVVKRFRCVHRETENTRSASSPTHCTGIANSLGNFEAGRFIVISPHSREWSPKFASRPRTIPLCTNTGLLNWKYRECRRSALSKTIPASASSKAVKDKALRLRTQVGIFRKVVI